MNGPDSDGHGLTLANTANKEAGIHTPSHEQRDPPTRDLADTSGGPFEDVDLEKDSHCALGDVGTTSSTIQDPGPSACIEKELHALAQLIQSRKLPDKSSCTSIAFANIAAVQSGAQFGIQPTFAAVLLRPAEAARRLLSKRRKPETPLLNGIDGIVRNGEMLLVLGRPGNVSSMLLKALSGQAQDGLHITGEIKYNGIDARDFKRRFKGDSIYVPDGTFLSFATCSRC
jgi:ABC-type multidrug transport system fused ATPase/permease subunit